MVSFQKLPQEVLEEILKLLIWTLPISKSVRLRSINTWFCVSYDRLLFRQKRLLSEPRSVRASWYQNEYGGSQHLYNLEGVIPTALALKLANYEWDNDNFVPKSIRLLLDQLEERIIGFCPDYTSDGLGSVRNDLRRAMILRLSYDEGVFSICDISARLTSHVDAVFTSCPELREIYNLFTSHPSIPQLTSSQSSALDYEASALAAAISDPRYIKAAIKSGKEPRSYLFGWCSCFQRLCPMTALEIATICSQTQNVSTLLDHASLDQPDIFRDSAFARLFELVAFTGNAEVAQIIIRAHHRTGRPPPLKMRQWCTPFSRACWNSHLEVATILESLLPASRIDRVRTRHINQAMRRSCTYGAKSAIIKYLVDLGASVDSKEEHNGRTPLMYAVNFGHKHLVRQLLSMGSNPQHLPLTKAWRWPVKWGDLDLLRILANAGLDLYRDFPLNAENKHPNALLPVACSYEQKEVVKFMLDSYPEIVHSQYAQAALVNLLPASMRASRREIIRIFLCRGITLSPARATLILYFAIDSADACLVQALIETGMNLDRLFDRPIEQYKREMPMRFSDDPLEPLLTPESNIVNKCMTPLALAESKQRSAAPMTGSKRAIDLTTICTLLRAAGAACQTSDWISKSKIAQP